MNTVLDILKQNSVSVPDNSTPDSEAATKIKQLFAEYEGVDITEVVNDAKMISDLGMDALDVVEFLMVLEQNFDVVMPEEIDEAFLGEDVPYLDPDADKKEALKEKLKGIEEGIASMRKELDDMESGSGESDNEQEGLDEDEIEEFQEIIDDAESTLNAIKRGFGELKEDAIDEFAEKVQDLEETVKSFTGEEELLKGDATVGEMIALVEWLVRQKDEMGE